MKILMGEFSTFLAYLVAVFVGNDITGRGPCVGPNNNSTLENCATDGCTRLLSLGKSNSSLVVKESIPGQKNKTRCALQELRKMSKRYHVRVKPSLVLLLQTDLKTLLRLYHYLQAYLLTLSNWKPAAGTSVSKTDAILCLSYLILRDLNLLLVLLVLLVLVFE